MGYLEQAKEDKAHVAVVMHYRTAVDEAQDDTIVKDMLCQAVEYAGLLKKPTDQKAVYSWAQEVIESKFGETELTEKVNQEMKKLEEKENATA